jgi:hypothetical protein
MKKTIQLGAALFALSFSTQAQPFTAQTFYDHSGTAALLSSGTYAVTNPGFIMVGYLPVAGGGGIPNYFLDKTDETGMLSGTGQFSGQYRMYTGGNLCVAALAQETNCYGLSVIERPTGGSILYAHAGAFDSGCVFATINNTGLPVSSAFYPFPSGASGITKPLIAASFTGDYYVCGSYMISSVQFMYAFKVTASGSTIWSQLYNLNASTTIPRGIIEETYSGAPELAVVGVENSTGSDNGFFMKIKGSSGAVTLLETIDSGSNEGLSSIALAASNNALSLAALPI